MDWVKQIGNLCLPYIKEQWKLIDNFWRDNCDRRISTVYVFDGDKTMATFVGVAAVRRDLEKKKKNQCRMQVLQTSMTQLTIFFSILV